jgi:integrase
MRGCFFVRPEQHITSSGNQPRLRRNCSFFWIKATTSYLRDIFAEAVDQDFLVKDPARKVTVPTPLRETDRTTLTWPQLRGALSKLELRDRILLELDMTNALRPGELFALRWECFNHAECTMRLMETVYKGKIRPWGKTRTSLGVVHVPKELADDLWLWKHTCPNSSPEAFIFPNKKGGFMDSNNYRKRVLHRLERELELPKLTFQVIRRTIAYLGTEEGDSERHSRRAQTLPHRNDS